MARLKILPYGDPILRRQAEPVKSVNDDILRLVEDMRETMAAAGGVGLAAPQVGRPLMLFLIDWSLLEEDGAVKAYLNPQIVRAFGKRPAAEEGCLSFPGVRVEVARPEAVEVKYQNLDGTTVTETLSDLPARVFQHEYDHLIGVLLIDRISPEVRAGLKTQLQDILDGRLRPFDPALDKREAEPAEQGA